MKPLLSPSVVASALACLLLTGLVALPAFTSAAATSPAAPGGSQAASPTGGITTSAQPAPQEPCDTTAITPVESAGASHND